MRLTLVLISIALFTGCASPLLPQKRTESVQATESIANSQNLMIERVTSSGLPSANSPFQESIKLTHDAGSVAGSEEDITASLATPLGISILVGCIGLGFLMIVWVFFSKLSHFGRAADGALGATTNSLRSLATNTTDMALKSQILDVLGETEKQRGKLK
jgi:hypothetical protein